MIKLNDNISFTKSQNLSVFRNNHLLFKASSKICKAYFPSKSHDTSDITKISNLKSLSTTLLICPSKFETYIDR